VVGRVARVKHRAPKGTVIAQRPPAGARTDRGGDVELLVSDGPPAAQTFLPDLTDLNLSDALALAEAAGFARSAVHIERVPGSGLPDGTVLSQNLTPLLSVPQRAQLRLNVATGRSLSAAEGGTPDLIGLGLAQAQLEARSVGLSVTATEEISTPLLPSGIVLQRPPPGTPLERSVEVTVNNPLRQTASGSRTGNVRRVEYRWLLEPNLLGERATVTVTNSSGQTQVIVRGQTVQTDELSGVYLTTRRGPLTFRLTLGGEPYGEPLTVNP
jgi:beta-lactam-binding protein with PASTA domain